MNSKYIGDLFVNRFETYFYLGVTTEKKGFFLLRCVPYMMLATKNDFFFHFTCRIFKVQKCFFYLNFQIFNEVKLSFEQPRFNLLILEANLSRTKI